MVTKTSWDGMCYGVPAVLCRKCSCCFYEERGDRHDLKPTPIETVDALKGLASRVYAISTIQFAFVREGSIKAHVLLAIDAYIAARYNGEYERTVVYGNEVHYRHKTESKDTLTFRMGTGRKGEVPVTVLKNVDSFEVPSPV